MTTLECILSGLLLFFGTADKLDKGFALVGKWYRTTRGLPGRAKSAFVDWLAVSLSERQKSAKADRDDQANSADRSAHQIPTPDSLVRYNSAMTAPAPRVYSFRSGYLRHFREVQVWIGARCRVEPLNPLKKKHRDRTGQIVGFVHDEKVASWVVAARVRFDDNNRVGTVDSADLITLDPPPPAAKSTA